MNEGDSLRDLDFDGIILLEWNLK